MTQKFAQFVDRLLGIALFIMVAYVICTEVVSNITQLAPYAGLITVLILTTVTLQAETSYRYCALIGLALWIIAPFIPSSILSLIGFIMWLVGLFYAVQKLFPWLKLPICKLIYKLTH